MNRSKSLMLRILYLGILTTCFLEADGGETTLYETTRRITAPSGFTILNAPNNQAKVVRTITKRSEITIAGYQDQADVRFYITDWSLAQARKGKRHYWVKLHSAPRLPRKIDDENNEAFVIHPEPMRIVFPTGYQAYSGNNLPEKGQSPPFATLDVQGWKDIIPYSFASEKIRLYKTTQGLFVESPGDSAKNPTELEVHKTPKTMSFPQGIAIFSGVRSSSALLKTQPGPISLNIKAEVKTDLNTYYISDFSWKSAAEGKLPNYVIPLEYAVTSPLKPIEEYIRKFGNDRWIAERMLSWKAKHREFFQNESAQGNEIPIYEYGTEFFEMSDHDTARFINGLRETHHRGQTKKVEEFFERIDQFPDVWTRYQLATNKSTR